MPTILKPSLRYTVAVVVTVMVMLPTACISSDSVTLSVDYGGSDGLPTVGRTMAGNYLSGRHAQAINDIPAATNFYRSALKISPGIPDLLRRSLVLTVVEGRMKEATALARKVVAINPKEVISNLVLVVNSIRSNRYAEAEKRTRAMPDSGINAYLRPLFIAWARTALGQGPDKALEALAPLAKKSGSKALYNFHAALINEMAGRSEKAEKYYLAAIKAQGGLSLRMVEFLGAHYERAKQPDKALELYRKYLNARPNSYILENSLARIKSGGVPPVKVSSAIEGVAEGLFGLSSSLNQQNVMETALVLGRLALFLKPDFPAMQIMIGEVLEAEKRLESANMVYAKINPTSPFSWRARLNAAFNMDNMDKTEEAIALLNTMADSNPGRPEPLINMGDILRSHERFAEAVAAYDKAIARIPKMTARYWSLLYSRGIALERSKRWKQAEGDFLKALKFEPEQPYVLNYLGYSWVDQGKNLKRAKKMIQKAVELRPNDGYIVDSLGWALYRIGDYTEAVGEMERAVMLMPEDPVINDHLGDVYWRVGRKYEARFQWRRALSFNPEPDVRDKISAKLKDGLKIQAKAGDDG